MGMKGWTQMAGGKKGSLQLQCSTAVSDTRTDHAAGVRKMEEESFHCCGKTKVLKLHTYIRQEVKTNCRTDTGTFKQLLLGLCIWLQNAWSKKAWQMFKTFHSALQKKIKMLCDWEHFLWLLIRLRKASDATGESYGWNEGHKFVVLIIFVLDWA